MKKWEYIVVNSSYENAMNSLGELGWELVSVDNGLAYFKREKIQ